MTGKPVILEDRSVISVSGPDARSLLERLITVEAEGMTGPRHGALLTPQGKILFEFIVRPEGEDTLLLDVHNTLAAEFVKRLAFYKLRAKAEIADRTDDYAVVAAFDGDTDLPADPRIAALGGRAILPRGETQGLRPGAKAYARHRMTLGVAELVHDFASGDVFPHEASYDRLRGVDFDKGCFVGQEVVSRMQHRGTARKRFVPVSIAGDVAEARADVTAGGKVVGTMGGSSGDRGLALLRLDRLDEAGSVPLECGGARLAAHPPEWLPAASGAEH
ncbi:MAG: folate-binding protein YgfZ [Flavobacteriaceae bacterium]